MSLTARVTTCATRSTTQAGHRLGRASSGTTAWLSTIAWYENRRGGLPQEAVGRTPPKDAGAGSRDPETRPRLAQSPSCGHLQRDGRGRGVARRTGGLRARPGGRGGSPRRVPTTRRATNARGGACAPPTLGCGSAPARRYPRGQLSAPLRRMPPTALTSPSATRTTCARTG